MPQNCQGGIFTTIPKAVVAEGERQRELLQQTSFGEVRRNDMSGWGVGTDFQLLIPEHKIFRANIQLNTEGVCYSR